MTSTASTVKHGKKLKLSFIKSVKKSYKDKKSLKAKKSAKDKKSSKDKKSVKKSLKDKKKKSVIGLMKQMGYL